MATLPLNITVDDTNPALIYSGVWTTNGTAQEYNATTHGTTQRGASVLFTFQGTRVAVFGTIGKGSPNSSYTIDDTATWVFDAPNLTTPAYHQTFFQSPNLTDSEHTLLIDNLSTAELWIDYFVYQPSASLPTLSSSLTTPSLQSTLTSRTVFLTSSPSSTASGTTSSVNKSSISAPAVAGGAVGALVIILLLIFGLLYYRRRAKQLAGEKFLKNNNTTGDPPQSDKAGRSAPIAPPTAAYTSSSHTSDGYWGSDMNMFPLGSAYPPSDYGYQNQSQPTTPIYHFSNHYPLRSGFNASSEDITGGGTNGGDTQYGYPSPTARSDCFPNRPQHSRADRHSYASPDTLAVPEQRHSLESGESQTSFAYLSANRIAMNPSSPLPDALPDSPPIQTTLQQAEKSSFIVHNPEVRQHEDGGVRLDVSQPYPHGSEPRQVVEVPPVYKPNY